MTVYNSPKCTSCDEVEVLHDIRRDGSRGACSVSTGATAVPCGCKSFAPQPLVQDLFPSSDTPGRDRTPTNSAERLGTEKNNGDA